MFTVIIAVILSVFTTILISIKNPRVHKKHKVNSAIRFFLFSGSAIGIIIAGSAVGILLAYMIGFFADGEYRKISSIMISPIPIDGEEYHYIKKTKYENGDTIVSLKFCFSDNSGDLDFYEYVITRKGYKKKTIEKGRIVELHFCEVETCCFRRDMYEKISTKGWLKYFGFCPSFYKMKIYIPKDANVKEIFI